MHKVCPKCGAINNGFIKRVFSNSGKQMYRCNECNRRFVGDHGQLTFYSHQDDSKCDQLIMDTYNQVPVEQIAATLNVSTYTVWRLRVKFLHMFEKLIYDTVVSGEVEM